MVVVASRHSQLCSRGGVQFRDKNGDMRSSFVSAPAALTLPKGRAHMKRHASIAILCVAFFSAFPKHAWANAGTPLMWAGMLHLAFGNLLIGIGEGYLLSRWFSVPERRGAIMILANYFSAWVGGFVVCGVIVDALPLDL